MPILIRKLTRAHGMKNTVCLFRPYWGPCGRTIDLFENQHNSIIPEKRVDLFAKKKIQLIDSHAHNRPFRIRKQESMLIFY